MPSASEVSNLNVRNSGLRYLNFLKNLIFMRRFYQFLLNFNRIIEYVELTKLAKIRS